MEDDFRNLHFNFHRIYYFFTIDNTMCNSQEINFENKKNKFLESVWVVVLISGLFMVYGGILDIMIYFQKTLLFVPPPWHSADARISLVFGVFVLIMAIYLILISFKVKIVIKEKRIDKFKFLKLNLCQTKQKI